MPTTPEADLSGAPADRQAIGHNEKIGDRKLKPATLMMGHGFDPALSEGSLKPPIFLTSTFAFENAAAGKRFFEHITGKRKGPADGLVYSRFNGPNQEILEDRLAVWDGADDALVFQVAPRAGDAALRRALRDFYEAEARADVGRWLPRHLGGLPKAPRRVQFKIMSSQWGSLAPDGSVALDLSLVLAEPEAFEYVLVHELCHLIHHDHSPAYWHEVEARYPEWRVQRDYFREHGRRIKGQLLALLR